MPGRYPITQRKAHHRAAIDAAPGTGINVFDSSLRIFQFRLLEQPRQPAITSVVHFAVDQQGQSFLKAHGAHARLSQLFFQGPKPGH